jgi:hypothetical protein
MTRYAHQLAAVTALAVLLAGATAGAQDDYSAFPKDGRDAQDRVIFKFEGAYNYWSTSVGDFGSPQPRDEPFTDQNLRGNGSFVLGNAAIGSRRLLLPRLNTYLVVSGGYDVAGAPETSPVRETAQADGTEHRFVTHAYGDGNIFLQGAYAELEGFTDDGVGQKFSLRAGRQSHWGIGQVTFDGGTLNYNDGSLNIGVRGGQRSGQYDLTQDDPGLFAGVDVAYDLAPELEVPLMLRAEYMFLSREIELTARDAVARGKDTDELTLGLASVAGYLDLGEDVLVSLRVKLTDTELSRARLGLRWGFGDSGLNVDLEQKIGEDVFFGLSGGKGYTVNQRLIEATGTREVTRASTNEAFRLNIPDQQPYTDLNLRLPLAVTDTLTVEPLGGVHFVEGETTELSPYDATHYRFGVNVFLRSRINDTSGLELELDYLGRIYDREDIDGEEGLFTDVAAGPETAAHEVYLGARYNVGERFVHGRMLQRRKFSVGSGYFLRAYTLQNRRVDEEDSKENAETLAGVSGDFIWAFSDYAALKAKYEFARDSNVFYSHLGDFHSVTGRVEVQF